MGEGQVEGEGSQETNDLSNHQLSVVFLALLPTSVVAVGVEADKLLHGTQLPVSGGGDGGSGGGDGGSGDGGGGGGGGGDGGSGGGDGGSGDGGGGGGSNNHGDRSVKNLSFFHHIFLNFNNKHNN